MFGRRRFRAPTVNPVTRELTDDSPLSNTDAGNSRAFTDKLAKLIEENRDMEQEFRRIEADELANKAKSSLDDDWQKRFRGWLVGRPQAQDKGKALWATPDRELNLMKFPSVRKYITSHADARASFEQMIERMRELGPYGLYGKVDILSTYIYFKYIVAGATVNSADWLSDFNTIESTNEYDQWRIRGEDGSYYNNNRYRREMVDHNTGEVTDVWDDVPTLEPGSYRDWNMTTQGQQQTGPRGATQVPPQGPGRAPVIHPGQAGYMKRFEPSVWTQHPLHGANSGQEWQDAFDAIPDDEKVDALMDTDVTEVAPGVEGQIIDAIEAELYRSDLTEPERDQLNLIKDDLEDILQAGAKAGASASRPKPRSRPRNPRRGGGRRRNQGPGLADNTPGPRPSSTNGPIRPGSMSTGGARPSSSTATPMDTSSDKGKGKGAPPPPGPTNTGAVPTPPPPPVPTNTSGTTKPEKKKPVDTSKMPEGLSIQQQIAWQLKNGAQGGLTKTGIDMNKLGKSPKSGGPRDGGGTSKPDPGASSDSDPEPPKGTPEHKNWERRQKDEANTKPATTGTGDKDLTPEELKARAEEADRRKQEAMRNFASPTENADEKKARQEKATKVMSAKTELLAAGVVVQGLNPDKTLAAGEALKKAKAANIPVTGVNGADLVDYVEKMTKKNPLKSGVGKKFGKNNRNREIEEKKEEAERKKEEAAQKKRDETIVKIDTVLHDWTDKDTEYPESFSSWALHIFGEVMGIKINQHQVMSPKFLERLKEEIIKDVIPPGSAEADLVRNASLYGIINEFQGPMSYFVMNTDEKIVKEEKYIAEHHALLESLGYDVDPLVKDEESDLHWEVADLITRLSEVAGPNPYDPNGDFMRGEEHGGGKGTERKLKGQLHREYVEEHNAAIRETVVLLWDAPAQDIYNELDYDEYLALLGWIGWIEGVVNDDAEVIFEDGGDPVNIRQLAGLLKREYMKPLNK